MTHRSEAPRLAALVLLAACGSSSSQPRDAGGDAAGGCGGGMTCSAVAPAGWIGYAALFTGAAGSAPVCPTGFLMVASPGNEGLSAADPTCAPCTCSTPEMGACTASGGSATVPPYTFADTAAECAANAGDACGTDQVCLPSLAAPFALCIVQSGDLPCPTGSPYSVQHVFYDEVDDTRGCTACTCGVPETNACSASGGEPTGSATPTGPVTACCLP